MENMSIEQLLQKQANVVQEMLDSNRNFTDEMVDDLTETVDALATKYKEEMDSYITKATSEIKNIDPTILKRRDYDEEQNYYIANRHIPDRFGEDNQKAKEKAYEKAYVEPPKVKGAPKNDDPERFIKIEDLDKYKELVKNYDPLYEFRHTKLTPYRREATGPNKVNLINALNEMKASLEARGIHAVSVEQINQDEIEDLPENKSQIISESVPIQDVANIESQMKSAMSDLKDYIGQMSRENMAAYTKFKKYKESAGKNINLDPERKLDLDNIVTVLNKFNYIISEINRQINNKESATDIFKKIAELHNGIKEAKNIIKDPEILRYLDKWDTNLERFSKLGKDYIVQEEQQRGRIGLPAGVQPEEKMVPEQNKQEPIALPAAKPEKSYENMSLEELEELLNKLKEERLNLWNTVVSAGDGASDEELARYEQLNEEIKKIEEELARRKARTNGNNGNSGNSDNAEVSYENMSLEELEELLNKLKEERDEIYRVVVSAGDGASDEELARYEQLNEEIKKIEEEIAKRREQARKNPDPGKNPDPSKTPTQEWKVEKRSVWQWIKDHKKQILIVAGLAAIAVATVVALQGLIPAITASMQANTVSTTCQAMLTNAANWHTAIASEQTALHAANSGLASMIEAMTGNKAVFELGSGIWKFGQSGMELGAFAKEAALAATKAAAKVTTLSRRAGLLGLGGLGSIGTGVLLQNRSAAYKVYNETIKEYKEGIKIGGLSGRHIDDLAMKIMNDDRLSKEEMQKLLRKLTKLANKIEEKEEQRNKSREQLEEVEAEEVNYEDEETQGRGR